MRKSTWVFGCTVAILGCAVLAAEKAPESYVKIMKANGAAVQSLGKDVEAKDYDAVAKDAAAVKAVFTDVEKFWAERKVDDALTAARTGLKAATDLETAARSKNDAGIAEARKTLTSTCAGCHMAHRERLADGTFEIK
jgi:cytochrome c556